jgi:multiple sugar transport system ATP-binding protein
VALVQLDAVTKVFPGGVRAVDGLDLRIEDRELVVLAGPSGCGKTTTLRLIAGLEGVSSGTIRIGQRVVNNVLPKDRDVAMVFQNYALYPHMSVYKNLAFGLKMRKTPRHEIQSRVMETAKVLGIEGLLDRMPAALSGGQKQRVALGRAIIRQAEVFLFDEPLSNLDARLRVTMRAELKSLHQRLATTTVYVTHDQEEAMTLGGRIVVMKDGRIQQADSPLKTYNDPVNRFVAGFVGMPPMNFFDGAMTSADGELVFEEGRVAGGELTLPGRGFRLIVPQRLKSAVAGRIGRHVVLGVRPEHLRMRPEQCDGQAAELKVNVNVIEPLGHDMDVHMETSLHDRVVGRVEASCGLQVGSQARMYADLRQIHFFEPGETGMNLSLLNESAHALA